jgi:glycolate oxidase iron-sulfur subunit
MQTQLADWIKDTPRGIEADAVLRKCVHCGFCLATCPTYTLLGDELDSPRGRIYLMKQMLEGSPVTARTQLHLDRCLTCRACETTCPSGVEYGKLVDIGRALVEELVPRSPGDRFRRWFLARTLASRGLFAFALSLGRLFRGLLPAALARKIPDARPAGVWPAARHARRMLVLSGCVQPSMAPSINAAAARVLDRLGISLTEAAGAGCCGAVTHHLNYQADALGYVRANIDAWWPHVEQGIEAIVSTASGCGTMLADYGHLLARDPAYAAKAARISELTRDIAQVVAAERATLAALVRERGAVKLAFHAPCSLQHGLKITGVVESILAMQATRWHRSRTRTCAADRRAPIRSCSPSSHASSCATRSRRSNRASPRSSPPRTSAASRTCSPEPRRRCATGSSCSTRGSSPACRG